MSNAQRRITLFADSLALPRGAEWGNIAYEKTYPYLLESLLRAKDDFRSFIFINRAQRFRTITQSFQEYEDFVSLTSADTLILHCGIVDCAPRVFSIEQRKWVESLPWTLQKLVVKLAGTFRKFIIGRLCPGKVYVPLSSFSSALENIFKKTRAAGVKVIAVNIIEPPSYLDEKSPGYTKNATSYNTALQTIAATHGIPVIDLNGYIKNNGGHDVLTTDGMHINADGHAFMAQTLFEMITR